MQVSFKHPVQLKTTQLKNVIIELIIDHLFRKAIADITG